MALKYGFFNSKNGDRKYTAAEIGDFLNGLVSSGVYHDSSASLQVLATGGMTVEVQAGRAMLNRKKLENDGPYGLVLAAGGTMDRIDAIVAYMDHNERACGIMVKEGTPAASPVAPTMERSDVRYEVMLASVYVTRLANQITQTNITDTRPNTSVCGWVHGLIEQVDTTTLFVQWQTAYEEAYAELGDYLEAQKAAWEKFFADVTTGNALPAPSLDDAGKLPTVNEAGNGYELKPIPTDSTLKKAGTPADAAATGAAIKKARHVNLLINSDFTKPVNQRGQTSYNGAIYCIDKWRSWDNSNVTTVNDGYISVTAQCVQTIATSSDNTGKTYTVAACNKDGEIYLGSGVFGNGFGDWNHVWADPNSDTNGFNVYLRAGDWAWAALYEGEYTLETLPEYQPKGYENELLVCRQYDPSTGEYIGLRNFGQPCNLLANSDFRNPVNRTGFTGGLPSADNVFFIDKWKTQQNATKNIEINFSDSGLIIHVSTGLAGIAQAIPKPKTGVTFAAKVNGKIETVYSMYGVDKSVKTQEDVLLYVEWQDDTVLVIIRNTGEDPNEYTIEWAALYEGEYTAETLPTYQPRGYSVESVICGAMAMDLLWENASPSSDFAAQGIGLDLTSYKQVMIEFVGRESNLSVAKGKNTDAHNIELTSTSSNATVILIRSRAFSVSSAGLTIGDNIRTMYTITKNKFDELGVDNAVLKPLRIWGIKGVTA